MKSRTVYSVYKKLIQSKFVELSRNLLLIKKKSAFCISVLYLREKINCRRGVDEEEGRAYFT